ncbi:MAG: NAD(P)/FAD-dependent oxidoreductase, partial [Thermoanaerobaculia bacterium]
MPAETRETPSSRQNPEEFDFAVVGGGPAGTSSAISLAQKGHRVVLFEKDRFPRFHIGESLLSTANDAFARLGVTERMAAACFPAKWGARLYTHDGHTGAGVDFTVVREVKQPKTVQVCREEFDRILMERARELGVDVREGHRVTACNFDDSAATIDFASEGTSGTVRARAMVDASGRQGLMAKKLNLRTEEPRLANIAIFSHFSGVPKLEGDRPDDIRMVARADAGWFWIIPISKELTSVGVVIPMTRYMQLSKGSPEEMLAAAFADTPVISGLMKNAKREWQVRVEKDFSYSASTYAGDRWILAG